MPSPKSGATYYQGQLELPKSGREIKGSVVSIVGMLVLWDML